MLPLGLNRLATASGVLALNWLPPLPSDEGGSFVAGGCSFVRSGAEVLPPGVSALVSQNASDGALAAVLPDITAASGDVAYVTGDNVLPMPANVVPQWIDLIAQASPGYVAAPDNATRFVAYVFSYSFGTGSTGASPATWSTLGAAAVSLIAEQRTRITMADLVGPAALKAFAPFDALAVVPLVEGSRSIPGAVYTFSVVAGCT